MNDREAVLRFTAFALLPSIRSYDEYGSLEQLLNWANSELDDPAAVSDRALEEIADSFSRAMSNAYQVFGAHAFRKWPVGVERLMPINRALFESWGLALSRRTADEVARHKDAIQIAARTAMKDDAEYIESISTSTSDPRRVRERFQVPESILSAVIP